VLTSFRSESHYDAIVARHNGRPTIGMIVFKRAAPAQSTARPVLEVDNVEVSLKRTL